MAQEENSPSSGQEVRPLRINKQLNNLDQESGHKKDRKIDATIGSKTSSMRSFWSDMEKKDTITPSPSSPTMYKGPNANRSSKVFENNIFIQSDRSSPSSPLPNGNHSDSSPNTPTRKSAEQDNSTTLATEPAAEETTTPTKKTTTEEELIRKSSIVRNGSVGKLQGPRQFGADAQTSPSKLKKVVTFNNSAQVIQYETVTPELSASNSFESQGDDGANNAYEIHEDEQYDQENRGVPVIDPTQVKPSPVRVSHSRPLPSIPPTRPDDNDGDEESDDTVGSDNDLPVLGAGDNQSELDPESDDENHQGSDINGVDDHENGHGFNKEGDDEHEKPAVSLTEPRALPGEAERQDLSLPPTTPELNRHDSLMEWERRVETQHVGGSTVEDSPTRTMSQRRRSLNTALELGSKVSDPTAAELTPSAKPATPPADEQETSPELAQPARQPTPEPEQDSEYDEKSLESTPELNRTEHDVQDLAKALKPSAEISSPHLSQGEQATENVQEDRALQEQLDSLDLGNLDYNQDEPLGSVEDDDNDLDRSGTVIHRPNARKISPHLYYEQHTPDSPHVPYRGFRHPSASPPEASEPPSIPVPQIPQALQHPPQQKSSRLRQGTPPMPEIKQEPVEQESNYGLPELKETSPLMNEFVPVKEEPVDDQCQTNPTQQTPQTTTPQPQQQTPTEPEPYIKQEYPSPPAKQDYTSPVPSLDHHHSPNSFDSPIKTERETTPDGNNGGDYARVYGQHDELTLLPMQDFTSEFDNLTSRSDYSQDSKSFADEERTIKSEPDADDEEEEQYDALDENAEESPAGPQTIRASGSRLKTRPSLTPMDVRRISSSRRKSSGGSSRKKKEEEQHDQHIAQEVNRVPVPVPMLQLSYEETEESESMFGDLDEQFDKLLQKQQRGYTIREDDSVVVATTEQRKQSDSTRKVSSPVKQIADRPKQLPETNVDNAPPLPPNAAEMAAPPSTEAAGNKAEHDLPSSDKGRLFVRVVSVKDIGLPEIDEKKAKFNLTLDNGIHCITTQYKQLQKSAFLDQEFELTVGDELEFILTVKAKYTKPKPQPPARKPVPVTPQQSQRVESKDSTRHRHGLSKIFGSPKKKQQQQVAPPSPAPSLQPAATLPEPKPDAWDSIVANDGSFGRSYIAFSQYQKEVYGRPATFEIPCFNEWARGPNRSKKQPYKIGKMQVQLMFVPRASKREVLPKSIKDALEELREARKHEPMLMEGCLSQLGGDCKYWRRRLFKLEGTMLTAYSETSGKPRATINLSKAVRVIDDKGSLTQPTVQVGKSNTRRKSAFAQQEEGFMFVNEAFRIRFKNNEIIDFYADDAETKQRWIQTLLNVIGNAPTRNPWTDLVMRRVAAE